MSMTTLRKPGSFTIRPADEEDIALIAELAHRIWPAAYQDILTGEQVTNMLMRIYSTENLRKEMAEGHRFWIVSDNSREIAFASGYRDSDIVWIKKIYVHPENKGLGLGRMLIETIEQSFAPVREVRLLVNPNNEPAKAFYRHIGFSEIGRKPVQMGDFQFKDHIFSRLIREEG